MTYRAGVEMVSTSELTCFRRCPKEHYFRYVLRRELKGPKSEALTKGTAGHKAIGEHHRGEVVHFEVLTPDMRALVRGYQAWWGTPDRQFACEQTDVAFQISLHNGIVVIGEFDGVGVRRDTGKRTIQEIKTSSEDISLGSSYWQKVALTDPQVTTYLLASQKKGWGHTEVLYDVMRKPDQKRLYATPQASRRYTKPTKTEPSRLYSDQRENDETDDEFELRILEDILKRPERYYQRGVVVRLEHEHEAYLRDVDGVVRLMQVTRTMGENVPRNVDSCFKYGRPCDFFLVCGNGVDVMNGDFYQRRQSKKKNDTPTELPDQPEQTTEEDAVPKYVF
jgi:PD-(D/E)XK nuclease superfamily